MIHPTQDPKYGIKNNKLVNMATGKPIPDDEPVMIFRAKDRKASDAIYDYVKKCENEEHRNAARDRWVEFRKFAENNPNQMKEPDTQIS